MTVRQFNLASFGSVVLLSATVLLCLATLIAPSRVPQFSLTDHFHIGICPGFNGDTFGSLAAFSDSKGPYTGSIMSISGGDEIRRSWRMGDYGFVQITALGVKREVLHTENACDLPGVYYRHFLISGQSLPDWTLMVSLWCPFFLFGLLPVIWILRRLQQQKGLVNKKQPQEQP